MESIDINDVWYPLTSLAPPANELTVGSFPTFDLTANSNSMPNDADLASFMSPVPLLLQEYPTYQDSFTSVKSQVTLLYDQRFSAQEETINSNGYTTGYNKTGFFHHPPLLTSQALSLTDHPPSPPLISICHSPSSSSNSSSSAPNFISPQFTCLIYPLTLARDADRICNEAITR